MSAERRALNRERTHRALDLSLTAMTNWSGDERLEVERGSMVENTDRLTIEEDSMTSLERVYMESVLNDYSSDLFALESSIREYRQYLRRLREKHSSDR